MSILRSILLVSSFVLALLAPSGSLTASELAAKLHWANGDSLPGDLLSADEKTLVWQSSLFKEPLSLSLDRLRSVDFDYTEGSEKTSAPFRIVLRNGNVLYGQLDEIDDDRVVIRSERHGEVSIARHAVGSLQRMDNPALIYLGPTGLADWRTLGKARAVSDWKSDADGSVRTTKRNAELFRRLELPEQAAIDVTLKAKGKLRFSIGLDDQPTKSLHLDTWDDELVVVSGDDFEPIRTINKNEHEIALRLYWNRKTGLLTVYSKVGKRLGTLSGKREKDKQRLGFYLKNKGADLTLSRLRVHRWGGAVPEIAKGDRSRIHLTDGKILYGRIVKFDSDRQEIELAEATREDEDTARERDDEDDAGDKNDSDKNDSGKARDAEATNEGDEAGDDASEDDPGVGHRRIAIDDVDRVALAEGGGSLNEKADYEIVYYDGTLLTGAIRKIEGGEAMIQTVFSDEPIAARLAGARTIQRRGAKTEKNSQRDKLYCAGGLLHGQVVGGDQPDTAIQWLPVGATRPSSLASGCEARIVRAPHKAVPSFNHRRFGDVLFLRNRGVVPCRVERIDERGIVAQTAVGEAIEVSHDQIQALELGDGQDATANGFGDPGWHVLGGDADGVKHDETKFVFKGKGSFGHDSILHGNEVEFDFDWGKKSSAHFTMRLFSDAPELAGGPLDLLVYCNKHNVTFRLPRVHGHPLIRHTAMRNVQAPEGKARVKIVAERGQVKITVNDKLALTVPIDIGHRAGRGIGFVIQNPQLGRADWNHLTISHFVTRSSSGLHAKTRVDEETKQEALTIPRFSKHHKPRHILIARNGDLLRGELLSLAEEDIRFVSRLDPFTFDRARVAAIVWLHESDPPPPVAEKTDGPEVRVMMDDGMVVVLTPTEMTENRLSGKSPALGQCEIPVAAIREFHVGGYGKLDSVLDYADWKPKAAKEPKFSRGAPDGGSKLVGTAAEDFETVMLDGTPFRLSQLADKIVVLDFWATWCGPCVRGLPETLKLVESYDADQVVLVAVDQGETPEIIREFLERHDWPLKVAMDANQVIGDQFEVAGIPHTVVISKGGTIASVRVGFGPGSIEELKKTIDDLIAGRAIHRPKPIANVAKAKGDRIGESVKPFTAKLLDGSKFELDAKPGKITVLDFWATWNGTSARALPKHRELLSQFDQDAVRYVAINQGEDQAAIEAFLKRRQLDLTVALDPEQEIGRQFKIDNLPVTIVIDGQGKIRWSHLGFRRESAEALRMIIQSLLDHDSAPEDANPEEAEEPPVTTL